MGERVARRNDPHAWESTSYRRSRGSCAKSTIVDELRGLIHFTSSLGTWQMSGGCLELPTVESRFGWSRRDEVVHPQSSKTEREVVPQRDEVWLKGNEETSRPSPICSSTSWKRDSARGGPYIVQRDEHETVPIGVQMFLPEVDACVVHCHAQPISSFGAYLMPVCEASAKRSSVKLQVATRPRDAAAIAQCPIPADIGVE